MGERSGVAAGSFSSWLADVRRAIRGEADAEVPCGACTACCTSSQFVHISPDETDALAHVPAELLFPAPLLPDGHVLLGYDEHGHCPMLVDGGCSIYEHRPRTCRTYDCRVFPATGVDPDDDKPAIAVQVRRWRFSHPSSDDEARHGAARAAAAFVEEHAGALVGRAHPGATGRAVLAVEVHEAFLRRSAGSIEVVADPGLAAVRVEVGRRAARRDGRAEV